MKNGSRDSSVGIEMGYELDGWGRFDFSLLHSVQTVSGAHPASYPTGTVGSFLGGKSAEREADHSPPSSAEAKNC
jgi:hypothetical protein